MFEGANHEEGVLGDRSRLGLLSDPVGEARRVQKPCPPRKGCSSSSMRPVQFTSGTPIIFGPFRITPHLVDHSAYDAHALEVEAGGRRLFYSGDLRGHGRKARLLDRLLAHTPSPVDVLLMEGSSLGRLKPDGRFPTETEIEATFVEIFRRTEGVALAAASAQNIDRVVSLYRACKRTGRTLIIDLYAAEILRATGNSNIPQSSWPNIALYVPQYQRVRIRRAKLFDLLERHKTRRVFPKDLKELAPRSAFLFRPAMLSDLDKLNVSPERGRSGRNGKATWNESATRRSSRNSRAPHSSRTRSYLGSRQHRGPTTAGRRDRSQNACPDPHVRGGPFS